MGKICNLRIGIEGIYRIGSGYVSQKAAEYFDDFFVFGADYDSYSPCHDFTLGISNDYWQSKMLYGLYGSLNIHPMEITGLLETSNSADGEKFQYQLIWLDNMMKDLQKYMKEQCDIDVVYKINYSVIDTPRELYNFEEFRKEI